MAVQKSKVTRSLLPAKHIVVITSALMVTTVVAR